MTISFKAMTFALTVAGAGACLATAADAAAPRRVVLVVQNHAKPDKDVRINSLTTTLTTELAGSVLQVINPYNAIGQDMNRTDAGETLPASSATGIARKLGAHGVITATVTDIFESISRTPSGVAYVTYKITFSINLADAWSNATICGATVELPPSEPHKLSAHGDSKRTEHMSALLNSAGKKCAEILLQDPEVKKWQPTPPAPKLPPEPLLRDDLQRALETLSDKMLLNSRFNERHAAVVERRSGKKPVVVVGGIGDLTHGESPCRKLANYRDLGRDFLQTRLGKSCRLDVKDLAAVEEMRPFVVNSPKDPLSDRALLEALRNYVSPDFLVAGHVKYDAENGLGTYFIHLGVYDFLLGVVVWEDTVEVVKSLPEGGKQ